MICKYFLPVLLSLFFFETQILNSEEVQFIEMFLGIRNTLLLTRHFTKDERYKYSFILYTQRKYLVSLIIVNIEVLKLTYLDGVEECNTFKNYKIMFRYTENYSIIIYTTDLIII